MNARPNLIRRCLTKHLNGRYSWMAIVFLTSGMFADLTLKSPKTYRTKREANRAMENVIKTIYLSEHLSTK